MIALRHQCNLVVPWNDPRRDIALKLEVQPHLFLVGILDTGAIATVMAGYQGHCGWASRSTKWSTWASACKPPRLGLCVSRAQRWSAS